MAYIQRRLYSCLLLVFAILITAASTFYGQTPETKTKPSGSISGRVTIGEKPAPGILVVVGGGGVSPAPLAQATSDAEGNYRLNGLAAGQVSVVPVAPVYVVPTSPMFGQGRVVNLGANESVEGIDFKLTRGGVITGRITDADGKPVIEERVNLIAVEENGAPARNPNVRPGSFMMLLTDDRGIYRVYGLPAGRYKVSVGDDGRTAGLRFSAYYQRVYYPDATEIAKAAIVDVSAGGETKNIDIKLGRRSSTFSVTGRVVEADTGKPLPNVYPSFGAVQQNQGQSYVSSTSGPSAPSNSQGEFRLEGLAPGRYVLMINASNFNRVSATTAPRVYGDPVPFEVIDGDVTNLEIKARRGLSISGVVVTDGVTDKSVLGRLPRFVIRATINPVPGEVHTFGDGSASSINPDGSFTLEGLRPGKVTVDIGYNGPDSPGVIMTRMELGGGLPIQGREVDLPPGQNISGLRVYLASGTGVVRGQVKVEGGTLPTNAILFVSVTRQGEDSRRLSGQVDSRGHFVIKGIPPGTYEVILQPVSMGPQPTGPLPRPQRQTITVVDGVETEVSFTLDLSRKDIP